MDFYLGKRNAEQAVIHMQRTVYSLPSFTVMNAYVVNIRHDYDRAEYSHIISNDFK